jgi:hypothetical protein
MRRAIQRQILADLGITWWHLRVPPGTPSVDAEPAAARAPDLAPSAAARAALEAPAPTSGSARVDEPPPAAKAQQPSAARRPVADMPAEAQPFAVQSLILGGVLLLVEDSRSRRDRRLAGDVLGAAAGDYRSRPVARRFCWPPEGAGDAVAGDADSGDRALRAFVDKDIADHGARLLLCTAPVAPRLGEGWPGCRQVTLPELATLARDVEAKRALWQALAEAAVR